VLIDSLNCYIFKCLINQPTKVSEHASTLIIFVFVITKITLDY